MNTRTILSILFFVLELMVLVVLVGVFSFRHVPYKERSTTYAIPAELKTKVRQDTEGMTVRQIAHYTNRMLCCELSFSRKAYKFVSRVYQL